MGGWAGQQPVEERIARALESIAASLEKMANPPKVTMVKDAGVGLFGSVRDMVEGSLPIEGLPQDNDPDCVLEHPHLGRGCAV